MKPISLALLALVLFSLLPAARAQVAADYMTVDAVQFDGYTFAVTGVVQGDAAPSTREITFLYGSDATQEAARAHCSKALLLALSKPGQYVVHAGPNACRLALVAP